MRRWLILVAFMIALRPTPPPAAAQAAIRVAGNQATIEFPDRITFSVNLKSEVEINQVILEYGVDQLTCGQVIAKAFPDFKPAKDVEAQWTWEMKQSGSLPPGSKIWWRWRVTDAAQNESVIDQKSIVWLDDQHAWQTIDGSSINLHFYHGGNSFGRDLHTSAVKSLDDLAKATGLKADAPVDLYIYADTADMRDAILFEPGWTGGLAYATHNIVIIGIAPEQIDWGKRTQAHELTHVLVGHLTFSCLSDIPTWLQEGLAVYGEGGPEPESKKQLEKAFADDELISVRSLSGNFSEDPAKADVSYSESYSLVNFLIEQYGQEKMTALLKTLRDSATVDAALQSTYGFDIDGFEDAWRARNHATPRANASARSTPTPVPTQVPTFVPVSGSASGPTRGPTRIRPTPTPQPTSPAVPTPRPAASTVPDDPGQATMIIIVIAIAGLIIAGIALIVISRRQQRMKG